MAQAVNGRPCHREFCYSIVGQAVRATESHWDTISSRILRVSLLILLHQCFTFTPIHMFLLPEEQKKETWKLHKMQCSFGNRRPLNT